MADSKEKEGNDTTEKKHDNEEAKQDKEEEIADKNNDGSSEKEVDEQKATTKEVKVEAKEKDSPKTSESRKNIRETPVKEKKENMGRARRIATRSTGINFKVGTKIEAMDYLKKWYPSKIVFVDDEEGQVLIHFEGWNQRYDEWLPFDSERMRPVARASTRKDGLRVTQTLKFKAGDEVHARWTDCKFYPAKVLSVNGNGTYEVYFFDGFKKTVQPINVRELPEHLKTEELFKDIPELEIERPRSGTPKKRLGSKETDIGKKSKLSHKDEPIKEGESRKRRAPTPTLFQTKKARLDQITGKLASKVSSTSPPKGSTTTTNSSKSGRGESTSKSAKGDGSKTHKSENKMAFKSKSDRLDQITGKLACKAKQASVPEPPPMLEYPTQPQYQDTQYHHHHPHHQQLLQRLHQEQMQGQKQHSVIASLLTQKPYSSSASISGEGSYPPPHHPPLHSPHLSPHSPYHMPHPPGMYGPLTSTGGMCLHSPPHSPYGSRYSMPASMSQQMSPTGPLPGYHHLSPTVVPPHLISPSPHHMALDVGPPYYTMGMTGMHDTPPDTPQYQSALMRMLQATSQSAASTANSMGMTYPPLSTSDGLLTTATPPASSSSSVSPIRTPRSATSRAGDRSRSKKAMTAAQLHVAAELALELAEGRIRTKDKAKVIAHKEITIAPKELVIDLDHKKFKCDSPGCIKAFRKQSGLEYHKKYYHSNKSKSRHLSQPSTSSSSSSSNRNRKRSSTSSLPSTRSSSCSSPSSPPSATISTDAVTIATAATTSSTLTATATDTVTTATTAIAKTASSSKSSHHRPSRIERKKRSSAPASLPAAQEQIIKSPVVMKPPETPPVIPEVKEEDKKSEIATEQSSTPTGATTSTPTVQEEVKTEADVSIETIDDPLTRDEIVHCVCNMDEEDGFMIQCDTCLCWQHSTCVGLNENTVPKKYICCFCKNPVGHRTHTKYKYDQEWFKTGELTGYNCLAENYSKTMAASALATHDLVGDMHVITDILHSVQCKLSILRTPSHPELRKWLKPWNKHGEEDSQDDSKINENDSMETEDIKVDENSVTSGTDDVSNKVLINVSEAAKTDDVIDKAKIDDIQPAKTDDAIDTTKTDDVIDKAKTDVIEPARTDDVIEPSKSYDVIDKAKIDDIEPAKTDYVSEPAKTDISDNTKTDGDSDTAKPVCDRTKANDVNDSTKSDDVSDTMKTDDVLESARTDDVIEPARTDDVIEPAKPDISDTTKIDINFTTKTDDVSSTTKTDDVRSTTKTDDVRSTENIYSGHGTESDDVASNKKSETKTDDVSNLGKSNVSQCDVTSNTRSDDVMTCKGDKEENMECILKNKEIENRKEESERTECKKCDDPGSACVQSMTEMSTKATTIQSENQFNNKTQDSESQVLTDPRTQVSSEEQHGKEDSKIDEVAMETEESKEEEDPEDMEVDVVNDDTTEDVTLKLSCTNTKVDSSLENVTKDSNVKETQKIGQPESGAEILNKKGDVTDPTKEQGKVARQEIKKVECEGTGDKEKLISGKVDDGNGDIAKEDCTRKDVTKQEQRQDKTDQITKEIKMSKDTIVQKEELKGDEVKKDVGIPSNDYQNRIAPSGVKLTGSSVWTQVGRAKGSSRKRTESLRSERSELSEIDVVEDVEPLPPLVCEWNLLQHIAEVQGELDQRMDVIEQELTALEATYGCPVTNSDVSEDIPHLKRNMRRLIHDLTKIQELVR